MLEAVNSTVQTAVTARATLEQTSTLDSFAANPARIQRAPQAPYVSPYVRMDVNFDKAVLQLRDGDTGDVVFQIPSQPALEAYQREAARQSRAEQTIARQQERVSLTTQAPQQQAQQVSTRADVAAAASAAVTQPRQASPAPQQAAPAKANPIRVQQFAAFAAASKSGGGESASGGNIVSFA